MSAVPEQTLNWLYSVLTNEYVDVNRTYSDTAAAISHFRSFNPRTEVYTYESGQSALLLQLQGLLPVTFRAVVYRFPVTLWIPHAYPTEAPMLYVVPSQDMLVRPGQHVSADGRIYHPYLAQWGQYWDRSSILDFLEILRQVFAKEPPVISKQQAQFGQQQQRGSPLSAIPSVEQSRQSPGLDPRSLPINSPVPPPKPPKPYTTNEPSPLRTTTSVEPPPIPQKPYQVTPNNYDHQQHQPSYRAQSAIPRQAYNVGGQLPSAVSQAPIDQARQQYGQQLQQHQGYGSPVSPIAPDGNSNNFDGRYSQPAPVPQRTFQPSGSQQQPPFTSAQFSGQPQQRQNIYPQERQQFPPGSHHQQPPQRQSVQAQAGPEPKQPIPDLLDAPLDVTLPSQGGMSTVPAPPIPPNPEKDSLLQALSTAFVSQITNGVNSNNAALPVLRSQQSAMRTAHTRLQSELDQLQQLDATLATNERIISDAMREADRVMEDARTRKVPDVDDVLVAPTVVGGQLYKLCAEERACADTMFVLGRGLDKGRIPADVYVKQIRSLAREQFLKKALIKKVAKGMGLDDLRYGR